MGWLKDELTQAPCPECDEVGSPSWASNGKCNKCGGSGDARDFGDAFEDFLTGDNSDSECERCGGDGVCPRCDGDGWVYDEDDDDDDE